MYYSYTSGRNLFGSLTNNTASTNLTLGDSLINNGIRKILRSKNWPFLNKSATTTTTASTQFYALPYDFHQLLQTTVTVGTYVIPVKECPSREFWNQLNQTSSYTSNYPQYYYIFNGQIGFWPTPSTSSYTVTYQYKRAVKDLSVADYTTGTITAITSGATTVTGSGTTWTTKMAGRFIRITDSDTANAGDGFWYEIASVTNTTTLVLARAYGGPTISAGSAAYTIGQVSLIPEDYQELPIYDAARVYFVSVQPDAQRAQLYAGLYAEGIKAMIDNEASPTTSPVIEEGSGQTFNPNLFISA